jgi:ABC-2 type transport system permease protein
MADLSAEPRFRFAPAGGPFGRLALEQYAALAFMRLRIFVNTFRSASGAVELGARTVSYIIYSLIGGGLGVGAGFAAYLLTVHGHLRSLAVEFWALLVLWQAISIVLASFMEQFDLSSLLRFPMSFGSFVVLHLVSGVLDVSTVAGGLACLGVLIGIGVARPGLVGIAALALLGFAAFNVLLVRMIFAWLDRWLAQRRSREIVSAIFIVLMLSLQLLNPALHEDKRSEGQPAEHKSAQHAPTHKVDEVVKKIIAVQVWLPPGLATAAITNSADGKAVLEDGSLGLLGLYGLGVAGLLCIRLRAEYRGENLGEAPGRKEKAQRDEGWLLPQRGPISAQIERELRVLLRSMTQLYAICVPPIMVVIIASLLRNSASFTHRAFYISLPVCVAYGLLGFTQLMYNNLGAEGKGIQLLFLFPVPLRKILLAKNLFHGVLYLMAATVSGGLAILRTGRPQGSILAMTVAWLAFALPANLAAGNLMSVLMAYRVNLGRLGRQSGSQANALTSMLIQTTLLGMGGAVVALCSVFEKTWLAVPLLLVLALISAGAWILVLRKIDKLAYRRRDVLIAKLARVE